MKKILGGLVVLATMSLMAVTAQAAQYSVTSELSEDKATVTMTINVSPDEGETNVSVNGYAVQVDYDSTVLTPVVTNETDVTGANLYATNLITDTSGNAIGVTVADLIDNDGDVDTVAIGWADSSAVTFTQETAVAQITFTVLSQTDTEVTVDVVALANDSTTMDTENISTTTEEAKGTITFTSNFLRGDADGNGVVDINDAALVANYSVGLEIIEDENMEKADADVSGSVDINDATLIANYAAGLEIIPE